MEVHASVGREGLSRRRSRAELERRLKMPVIRVEHEKYGCVLVHAGSIFDALVQAAAVWGVSWMDVRESVVEDARHAGALRKTAGNTKIG